MPTCCSAWARSSACASTCYSGSWEKAQEEVTSGRADLLAGAYLTLARLGSMDYVHPPFLMTSGVVWVNKDAAFPFIGRDDLIGHKGSVLAGSSLGEEFDRFAKASLDLKPVPSLTQGLQDLMLKRSEFLLYQALPGRLRSRRWAWPTTWRRWNRC